MMSRVVEFCKYKAEKHSFIRVLAHKSVQLDGHFDEDFVTYNYGEFVEEIEHASLHISGSENSPECLLSICGPLEFISHILIYLMQQCDINILTSEEGYDIAASNFKGDTGLILHSIQLPLSNERMITIKSQFPRLLLLVDQLRKLSKASVPYSPEHLVPPKMISTYEVPHTPEEFTEQQVLAERPLNVQDHITKTITLPNSVASRLAGRGFEKMLQLRRRTGTNIRITKVGIDASLSIRGPPAKVAIALRLIRERSTE